MTEKRISFEELSDDYCEFIDSSCKYCFYTCSKEKQKSKIAECENYLLLIKSLKQQAIQNNSEIHANEIFHMQCMVNSSRSFLLMWVLIKEGSFNKAWSSLVDAQEYLSVALKIKDYDGARRFEQRMEGAEDSIFPGWALYSSPGIVETIGKCSVCLRPFALCEHIENQIYMGNLCRRVDREIVRVDHFALVENPRDRRCVITKTTDDDGNEIDYYTLEKTGKKSKENGGKELQAVVLTTQALDFS